jgi:hypothetical protein
MGPRRHFPFVLSLGLGLAACAIQPTPYQPLNDTGGYDTGGYTEQQIDDATWRVQFTGNADTPRETVENYLLYRAAEITLAGGYDKFAVLNQEVERTVRYRAYGGAPGPGPLWSYWRGNRYGSPFGSGYSSMDYQPIDNYTAHATIRAFAGSPPQQDVTVYDARQVVKNLAPTIVVPQATDG